MGVKQKFLYAGTADGHAWGWNETTTVVVMTFEQPLDGFVHAVILAAGPDAERLRKEVGEYVAGGLPDAATPEAICSPDLGVKASSAPAVDWLVQPRAAVATARFFQPVAELTFEKRGCQHGHMGPHVVLGGSPQGATAVFALPGPTATKIHFAAVTFGSEEEGCRRVNDQMLSAVVKTLYD